MAWIDVVVVAALVQYFGFSVLVGRARKRFGVRAPAVSGNEQFERVHRVHMNTLELLVIVVPALELSARYWPPPWMAGLGAVYLVGRIVYCRAYLRDPASRSLGFALSAGPALALLGFTLVGALGAAGR